MNEQTQIINVDCPQKYSKVYSALVLKYKHPAIQNSTQLLSIDDIIIPIGITKFTNLEFSEGPVIWTSLISLKGATNCRIRNVAVGTWGITIEIENTSTSSQVGNLEVYGCSIGCTTSEYYTENPILLSQVDTKTLIVDTYLHQNEQFIAEYAQLLLQLVSDPTAEVTLDVRGNPLLELGDTITIDAPIAKLNNVDIVPVRYTYKFDGGLEGAIVAVRRSSRVLMDWVYVSPGLYAKVEREIT
jgi:hypothetical protein